MGRAAFTTETFGEIVKKESNGTMELDDEYINISTKVWFKCNKGHRVKMAPNRFRYGDRCSKCSGKYKPTTEEVGKEIEDLYNGEYSLDSEYKNNKSPIYLIHNVCGHRFKNNRDNLINRGIKCPCPKCQIHCIPYTNKTYEKKFYENHKDLILLQKWSETENNKIRVKCKIHNYEWDANKYWINRSSNPTGCPICSSSKGESKIRQFLLENKILFEEQKRFDDLSDKRTLPFDFMVSVNNKFFLIEYDGEFHEKSFNDSNNSIKKFEKIKKHDKMKNEYCLQNNIELLRINYRDFSDINVILQKKLKEYEAQRLSKISCKR